MKIGYIILCRYNSSRLPGKILMKVKGKEIIKHIYDKLLLVSDPENIVVATSDEYTDDPIENFCKKNKINIYRGSLKNVSKRFLDCSTHFSFDFAVRINGDNLFMDISTINKMVSIVKTNNYDFVSNVKDRTFPKGMSVEIVRVAHYKNEYNSFNTLEDFEHVTYYLYKHDMNKKYFYYYNKICPVAAGIQLAIDTKEDFELAKRIINNFDENKVYDLKDIYNFYKKAIYEK